MKPSKKKKSIPPALQEKITELEQKALNKGIHVHFDLMEAAGLKLKGGICKIRNEFHLFIDKRKTAAEKIEILNEHIDHPLPEDIPENENAPSDVDDRKEKDQNIRPPGRKKYT